jgi:hypothetical protein
MEQANHHHRQPELSCREGVSRALRSLIPTWETIIVVTGIQAAGKSTVSHLLAQRFARGVHVEADVLQHMIVSGSEGVQEPGLLTREETRQYQLRVKHMCLLGRCYRCIVVTRCSTCLTCGRSWRASHCA